MFVILVQGLNFGIRTATILSRTPSVSSAVWIGGTFCELELGSNVRGSQEFSDASFDGRLLYGRVIDRRNARNVLVGGSSKRPIPLHAVNRRLAGDVQRVMLVQSVHLPVQL